MNKSLCVSKVSEPPLLMLFLATFTLVFNLCFPQYTAVAHKEGQKFAQDTSLKDNLIALNEAKMVHELGKDNIKAESIVKEETFSELTLETKPVVVKAKPVVARQAVLADKVNETSVSTSSNSKWVTVTAYSSTVDQCDDSPFITASGTHVRDGIIATNLLAFGTKVKFPSIYGDKIFTVEDRMNRRFSDRADIWFETREQAKQFGIRKLEMVIVS